MIDHQVWMDVLAAPAMDGDALVRVHWCLGIVCGFGAPMRYKIALVWIALGNAKYGSDTHWAEPEVDFS